jgi:hypothetical protein
MIRSRPVIYPKDALERPPAKTRVRVQSAPRVEARLRTLERLYREALSGAVVAKSRYLALVDERSATGAAIERAYSTWQQLELRRRVLAVRMAKIEDTEQPVSIDLGQSRAPQSPRLTCITQLALEV